MQKYDVYVWGQVREFKPLTIEICNNSRQSNYFPQEYKNHYRQSLLIDMNGYIMIIMKLPIQKATKKWPYFYLETFKTYFWKWNILSSWRCYFSSKDRTRYGENGLKDKNGNDYSPRIRRTGNTVYKILPKLPIQK